jgi:RimJ/RimL family protein N-acetyltransferase
VTVLETNRLALRRLTTGDAEFIVALLNQPSFLRYIGDKQVRNTADAVRYLETGPIASYERFGFGLYLVALRATGVPIGMCGLLKREQLTDVDIGFAFLPEYWARGYAFEAAGAVMRYARDVLFLKRIVAITSPDNDASIRLLKKLGLEFEGMIKLSEEQPEVRLFGSVAVMPSD